MPDDTLPTEDEIATLPRWARVAFAARCARRAQPFYFVSKPDETVFCDSIEEHIESAETCAARRLYRVDMYAEEIGRTIITARNGETPEQAMSAIEAAAAAAATAVAHPMYSDIATIAADAANAAARAGVSTADLRSDFDSLVAQSQQEKWTDHSPVPPTVFTPLPHASHSGSDVAIQAGVRDGVDSDTAKAKLLALYNAMNDYTIAKFGKPLTIKDFQEHVLAGIPEGVQS